MPAVAAPTVTCTLDAGGNTDSAEVAFGSTVDQGTLSMLVTQVFPATGSIVVRCRSHRIRPTRA